MKLVAILFLLIASALAACPNSGYVDSYPTPVYPAPPSTTLSGSFQPAVTAANPLTQNHWSETANIAAYRPPIVYSTYNSTSCPHLQSGLKNWHDPATWSGSVPANGADVSIPANTAVLVASCSIDPTFIFGTITIPVGSKLIFGDANINITAKGFNVQGALLAGSATCRISNNVVITLAGTRSAQALPAPGFVKGISVLGSIDLHGAKYSPTWTRLAMTAKQNDTYIFVQDIVNWQPGQRIVITTTELKDARDFNHNEERTIVSVQKTTLGGGSTKVTAIQLDQALSYRHFGGQEYQAEVSLLSRNIVVQGDANSLPTDTANVACTNPANTNDKSTFPCENSFLTGFGGHIIVDGSTGTNPQGRFSGVELFRVGQTNVLGRYPVHFHMIGDVTSNNYTNHYVQDSAVHDSYFRCYAIHGTQGVKLSENTAYNAIGHCYFLEDGVEENNTITYNQAAHVHPLGPYQNPSIGANGDSFWSQYLAWYSDTTNLILPSDMSAGCFYITNPYNDFVGNAASGGWAGYSVPSFSYPVKLHYGQNTFCPKNRPFRTPFRGNSAHSSGYWWQTAGGIYVGGELQQDSTGRLSYTSGRSATHDTCTDKLVGLPGQGAGCYDLPSQLWLRFEDNKVFLANRGMQHWGERSEIVRLELHDVSLSMNVFGKVWIDDMLMECRTQNNRPTWFNGCPAATTDGVAPSYSACNIRDLTFFNTFGGFQWYDVGQMHILTNSTFRNCQNTWGSCVYGPSAHVCSNVAVFTSLTHSDQFVPEIMQVTHGVTYENVTDLWRYSTKLTDPTGLTVSGRLQGWYDSDGSASRIGVRAMIGSNRSNEWWKYNSGCTVEIEAYKCALAPKDSKASVVLHHNVTWEAQIGNSICENGGDGTIKCPVIGKVTHFGRNESLGLEIAVNAKVTGPIIDSAGGWFIRFTAGTPKQLNISAVQVDQNDVLLLAIPYPANTNFTVYNFAATWCDVSWGVCRHNYRAVTSIAAVKSAFGDAYFWDNNARILYLRVVTAKSYYGGLGGDTPVWSPFAPEEVFSRAGETLIRGSQGSIIIEATCATNPCAPQPTVAVPAALNLPTTTAAATTTTSATSAASTTTSTSTSATTKAATTATTATTAATTASTSATTKAATTATTAATTATTAASSTTTKAATTASTATTATTSAPSSSSAASTATSAPTTASATTSNSTTTASPTTSNSTTATPTTATPTTSASTTNGDAIQTSEASGMLCAYFGVAAFVSLMLIL